MSGRFTTKRDDEAGSPAASRSKVTAFRAASLQASERRVAEKRERRHRERAVTEWLRSLDRAG
jgi:hypothetical protein